MNGYHDNKTSTGAWPVQLLHEPTHIRWKAGVDHSIDIPEPRPQLNPPKLPPARKEWPMWARVMTLLMIVSAVCVFWYGVATGDWRIALVSFVSIVAIMRLATEE